MAVIVDATGTKLITTVAGTTVNYTGITVGTGVDRALVVTVACAAAVTAPNAHWDTAGANQAMTLITAVKTQTNVTTFMFGLRNPVAGAKTLNVAWTTSAASNVEAISFTDVDQTSDAKAFINANFVSDGGTVSSILMGLVSPADSIAVASYATSATFSSLTGTNLFTDTTNTGCEGAASRSNGAGATINFTGADTSTAGNKVMVGFVVAPVIPVLPPPLLEPVRSKIAGALAIAIMASGLFSGPLPPKEDIAKVDRWYSAWQDPVWPRRGLAAHEQQFLARSPGLTKEDIPKQKWTVLWQDPVRVKSALGIQHQPSLAWSTFTPAGAASAIVASEDGSSGPIFKYRLIYKAKTEPIVFTAATTPIVAEDGSSGPTFLWQLNYQNNTQPVFVPPVTVSTMARWPDFAPKAKPTVDFKPWTFLEPPPQVFFPYAPWPDFARRKQPPLDTQPLAWNSFQFTTTVPTMAWTNWPDFAPRAKPATDPQSFAFVPLVPTATTIADWPDFARRAPQPLDVQSLPWDSLQIAATAAPTWTTWTPWPDLVPTRKKPVADLRPWTFLEPPPQVFFPYAPWDDFARRKQPPLDTQPLAWSSTQFVTVVPTMAWTNWPDFAPKAKPLVDLKPWSFVEPPPQVFFPYGPWDDFARRKPQPLDTAPLIWSGFTPLPPVSTAVVASEDGSSGPTFKWRLIYRVKTEPVFVPPVVVPTMAWTNWPDFAPKARPSTDPQSFAFLELVPSATVIGDWPDFARRKQPPLDTQPQAFVFTPSAFYATVVYDWPDFARRKPQPIDTQPLAGPINFTATVINTWAQWPDFAPRKKSAADFIPWTFIPIPRQVFFPYAPWDDFTRRKPQPLDTQPLIWSGFTPVEPTLVTKWFEALSTPPGPKRGLGAYLQSSYTNDTIAAAIQLFARTPWYAPLSEPVRIKPGLRAWLQKFLERDPFGTSVFLASLQATEQGDFLTAVLSQFNTPISAYVDIVQNDPRHLGNLGIIENVAQSSIVASIAEPQTVPATGQPVSTVAGARVAIIVT